MNLREGVLQALKIGAWYNFIKNSEGRNYSFFVSDSWQHNTFTGSTGYLHKNSIPHPSWINSIPTAVVIEGCNGLMIDNSLDRGGRLAKKYIKQWEQTHTSLHPALKWSLIRAGRAAGSFVWACVIGTLRTLKNSDTNQWKIPSKPQLRYGLRLEVTGFTWEDVKMDVVIRA